MSALPPKADIRHDDPACMHPSKGVPKLDVFHDGLAPESGTPLVGFHRPEGSPAEWAVKGTASHLNPKKRISAKRLRRPQISALSPNATCCSTALNSLEMGKKRMQSTIRCR